MTDKQLRDYIISNERLIASNKALIQAMGMKAENDIAKDTGRALPYDEIQFVSLIDPKMDTKERQPIEKYHDKYPIRNIIIKTSDQGYKTHVYVVKTNASVEHLKQIDERYGTQTRNTSTTIDDLQTGAITEGFVFEYHELLDEITKATAKEHYFANYGNY